MVRRPSAVVRAHAVTVGVHTSTLMVHVRSGARIHKMGTCTGRKDAGHHVSDGCLQVNRLAQTFCVEYTGTLHMLPRVMRSVHTLVAQQTDSHVVKDTASANAVLCSLELVLRRSQQILVYRARSLVRVLCTSQ